MIYLTAGRISDLFPEVSLAFDLLREAFNVLHRWVSTSPAITCTVANCAVSLSRSSMNSLCSDDELSLGCSHLTTSARLVAHAAACQVTAGSRAPIPRLGHAGS